MLSIAQCKISECISRNPQGATHLAEVLGCTTLQSIQIKTTAACLCGTSAFFKGPPSYSTPQFSRLSFTLLAPIVKKTTVNLSQLWLTWELVEEWGWET